MILSGSLLPRLGPRLCAVSGGILFGSGWLFAGLGCFDFAFTVAGIGVLAGIGVGFAYIVPIATCIRWFPQHKGLVTGIAVAGFGGGAALVSQIAGYLIGTKGSSPFETFVILGALFLVMVTTAGLTMKNPPEQAAASKERLDLASIIGRKRFWILFISMAAGLAAGFAVNANLKELYPGSSLGAGVRAVSFFALANAIGRITWGIIFDRLRSTTAIQANLICQAVVLSGSQWILQSNAGLMVFALLTGFNYGGVLVIYASSAARAWGNNHVGQVYGWIFAANIPAALSPIIAGSLYDYTQSFTLPLGIIAAMMAVAALWVKKSLGQACVTTGTED